MHQHSKTIQNILPCVKTQKSVRLLQHCGKWCKLTLNFASLSSLNASWWKVKSDSSCQMFELFATSLCAHTTLCKCVQCTSTYFDKRQKLKSEMFSHHFTIHMCHKTCMFSSLRMLALKSEWCFFFEKNENEKTLARIFNMSDFGTVLFELLWSERTSFNDFFALPVKLHWLYC